MFVAKWPERRSDLYSAFGGTRGRRIDLPAVKFLVRNMTHADAKKLAEESLATTDQKKTYSLIESFYNDRIATGV